MPADIERAVEHLKKHPEVENPYALAHWMKNQGMKLPGSAELSAEVWDRDQWGGLMARRASGEAIPGMKPRAEGEAAATTDVRGYASASATGSFITADVPVRGKFLSPGTWRPSVEIGGKMVPGILHVSREVIVEAYADLKARVAAGVVDMQLSHPDTGGMALKWGIVRSVRLDPDAGEAWLDEVEILPAMRASLTPEAVERLSTLALSVRADFWSKPHAGGKKNEYDVLRFRVNGIDIVDKGASPDSGITRQIPMGLTARFTGTARPTSPGTVGHAARANATTNDEGETVPKMTSEQDVPEEIRQHLPAASQRVYMEAYNAAVDEQRSEDEAHKMAKEAAGRHAMETLEAAIAGPEGKTPERKPMNDKPAEGEAKRAKAALAAAQAEAQRHKTALAAAEAKVTELSTRLEATETEATTEKGRLAAVESELAQMRADKTEAEVVGDVERAIRSGRVAASERPAQLVARRKLTAAEFKATWEKRPVIVPVGELGGVEPLQAPGAGVPEDEQRARRLLSTIGVQGVLSARLHDPGVSGIGDTMSSILLSEHATDPDVRTDKLLKARLVAARKAGGS